MPIKLIQVQRKLNVGMNTAVEFLHKKGHEIEDNPNTRISDEQYALLVKEFGKDLSESERNMLLSPPRPQREKPETPKKEEEPEVLKTVVPDEFKPKFVTKGHIDLEQPKKAVEEPKEVNEPVVEVPIPVVKKEEPVKVEETPREVHIQPEEPVVQPQAAPVPPKEVVVEKKEEKIEVVIPKEEKVEYHKEEKEVKPAPAADSSVQGTNEEVEEKDNTPFRLNTTKIESNIKVTGRIDLTALNQSTRPKKKSKEEKRKERDEKNKVVGNRAGSANPALKGTGPGGRPLAAPVKAGEGGADAKKKRNRIKKDRIDINNTPGTNARPVQNRDNNHRNNNPRLKRPVKAEVNEEDVQKQIKETLARLTNKGNKGKGAKYRRDKRDAAVKRENELLEQEEMQSKVLKLTEFVTANDLANMMNVPVTQVIATCMSIGIMVSINQRLDAETINIVAEEFGFKTEYVSAEVVEAIKADEEYDNEEDWVARPPIVTVMGHVDHGKTSLLDNIRSANVIAGEAGGITQHIGAYNVKIANGRRITFLDTPGHEAFTAMRARGAKVTDIAIIIVAADDSVMPQTIEAINHASAAGVPIVFAINKIDKPGANVDKIKEELANMNYLVEDWGGKYQSQEISAKKGLGIEELLEKVLLEADLLDLKANPTKRAVGSIIESSLDKGRGYVSTVLIENGTLKMGDIVLAGTHHGRIKAMFNERNQRVEQAGPSEPVLILGLNGAPQAGDTFNVLETEQEAREIATRREQLQRELGLRTQKMLTLDDIGRRIAVGNFQELNVIVKGDVDGSVEALADSLIRLSTEEIQVNVIHKAVGQISESDVVLAAASNAIIIGFQVRPSQAARRNADKEGVEIRLYSIIYDAIEEVKSAMEGMLSPEIREEITANVEVQQVFKITKVGTIAGCLVREGKIKRSNKVRLIRDGIVIHSGELESLKRFKDDVKEVVSGQDCGLNIKNFNDIQVGDIVEAYEETEIKKTL
ncbi:translation initiation factor IF-2 [Parabacteroides sp. 52]|uniref:translation initiation factor IF-2 n=1 Tax=unclassified Parabacteroides TaxID=2649774 RepID=UPI0013CF7136|nr:MULTISPECIES: translation initiation factor IF-2 [unclassified Parabacteroides]MDH6535209.1 translation initiation factor IF-2 [Parabacteroides sp. PM5-20]NDV56303.1 translation initiation factor IF-2 [Parabacteroides sp. 52]